MGGCKWQPGRLVAMVKGEGEARMAPGDDIRWQPPADTGGEAVAPMHGRADEQVLQGSLGSTE